MLKTSHILVVILLSFHSLSAQVKIGVFDSDIMVQVMPGYPSSVDSVLQAYTNDSLAPEYNFYQQEYIRIDSSYRADSLAKKPRTVLDLKLRQKNELAISLMNWERMAQYRIQQKRQYLARPFYEKVLIAYKKVVAERKYDLVLKPNTYEPGTTLENVFVHVAKELNVKLPAELAVAP
jgi:Skp family chaperone for outer membrane proteins